MKKLGILILLGIFSCTGKEADKDSGLSLFKVSNKEVRLKSNLDYTTVEIDSSTINIINESQPATLRLNLPVKDGLVIVNLEKENLFDANFQSVSQSGVEEYKSNSTFYTGHVEGEDSSIVSINVVNGVISGLISSTKYGELVIGRENEVNTTSYLIYDPYSSNDTLSFNCSELIAPRELKKSIDAQVQQTVSRCITVDFELTYEVFQNFGTIQKSNDWLVAMFASVKAVYKAEAIDINISKIFNNTVPDGYSTEAGKALEQFTEKRKVDPNFKGNLAQLVRGRPGGALSGIAYVDVLCNNNYRFSYAEPMWNYAIYPAYSWSIMVITHELGHNIGSPHTHWCRWELSPGVFGAIDACYATEGGCPAPVPPAGGGTIMSYCHMKQGVGTNMKNGFGPIPGARIRDRYTKPCTACSTVVTPPPPPPPPPVPTDVPITRGKPVKQSSTYSAFAITLVNDGNEETYNHTNKEVTPWVQIDLGAIVNITKIRLLSRKDCCRYRMRIARVFVSNEEVGNYDTPGSVWDINVSGGIGDIAKDVNVTGRYLRVYVKNFSAGDYSHWAEIEAWGKTNVVCRDSVVLTPYTAYRKDTIKVCK